MVNCGDADIDVMLGRPVSREVKQRDAIAAAGHGDPDRPTTMKAL